MVEHQTHNLNVIGSIPIFQTKPGKGSLVKVVRLAVRLRPRARISPTTHRTPVNIYSSLGIVCPPDEQDELQHRSGRFMSRSTASALIPDSIR